jgi:hypothetical protein
MTSAEAGWRLSPGPVESGERPRTWSAEDAGRNPDVVKTAMRADLKPGNVR